MAPRRAGGKSGPCEWFALNPTKPVSTRGEWDYACGVVKQCVGEEGPTLRCEREKKGSKKTKKSCAKREKTELHLSKKKT